MIVIAVPFSRLAEIIYHLLTSVTKLSQKQEVFEHDTLQIVETSGKQLMI